jgi:hypothetical protein
MTPRQQLIFDAIKAIGTEPITLENLAPHLPEDFGLEASELTDANGQSIIGYVADFSKAVKVEPHVKSPWLQDKIDAAAKPDPFEHVQDRAEMQTIVAKAQENTYALQTKLEVLRRKVGQAREALARSIAAYQSGMEPANLPMDFAKEQSEIRRQQRGTHGEFIRRQRAAAFVQKQQGTGNHRGGMNQTALMRKQILETGKSLPFNEVPLAAPKLKLGQ